MLLVQREFNLTESSWILSCTKAAQPLAFLAGGFAANRYGSRPVLLLSFLIGATGLLIAPFAALPAWVLLGGVLAQFGTSLFNPAARSLIRAESSPGSLRENLAWMRTANNLGQVVSSLIALGIGTFGGALGAAIGLVISFCFDALTSVAAFIVGIFAIPRTPSAPGEGTGPGSVRRGFYLYSVALLFYSFLYELGFMSFSAFAAVRLGPKGIQAFALASLINTALCGLLAVPASRWIRTPARSLPIGIFLVMLGGLIFVRWGFSLPTMALASLVFTLGELIFAVHSQTLLLANSSAHGSSHHYGASLTLQGIGRFLAGWALFPLIVHGAHSSAYFIGALLAFGLVFASLPRDFVRHSPDE